MTWTTEAQTGGVNAGFANLDNSIGVAGASESVAIVAIIWGIVIIL